MMRFGTARCVRVVVLASSLAISGPAVAAAPAIDVEQAGAVLLDAGASDRARLRSARRLTESADPRAEEYLLRASSDTGNSAALRAALLQVLSRLSNKKSVSGYLAGRLTDIEEIVEVRASAATALGVLAQPDAIEVLQRHTDVPETAIRVQARLALLAYPAGAVDRGSVLLGLLTDREAPAASRARAARELGRLREARARGALIAALAETPAATSDASPLAQALTGEGGGRNYVAAAAARALGELGDPLAVPALLAHATAESEEMRIATFAALAQLRDRSAIPAARKALATDKSFRTRRWAAVLLKEQRDPETLPDLRRALEQDEDPGVRLQVVQALEAMNDRESVARIRSALEKEKLKEVRAAMEHALARLSPPAPPMTTN